MNFAPTGTMRALSYRVGREVAVVSLLLGASVLADTVRPIDPEP